MTRIGFRDLQDPGSLGPGNGRWGRRGKGGEKEKMRQEALIHVKRTPKWTVVAGLSARYIFYFVHVDETRIPETFREDSFFLFLPFRAMDQADGKLIWQNSSFLLNKTEI